MYGVNEQEISIIITSPSNSKTNEFKSVREFNSVSELLFRQHVTVQWLPGEILTSKTLS